MQMVSSSKRTPPFHCFTSSISLVFGRYLVTAPLQGTSSAGTNSCGRRATSAEVASGHSDLQTPLDILFIPSRTAFHNFCTLSVHLLVKASFVPLPYISKSFLRPKNRSLKQVHQGKLTPRVVQSGFWFLIKYRIAFRVSLSGGQFNFSFVPGHSLEMTGACPQTSRPRLSSSLQKSGEFTVNTPFCGFYI